MFYVYQYQPDGKIALVATHRRFDDAVNACRFAEEIAEHDGSAAYITHDSVIVGDSDGRIERDYSHPYDASGCAMTGREW